MGRIYLDWNATAPLRPEARAAMLKAMDLVGNPSSVHTEGRAAKAIVDQARGQVADLVGCDRDEVVFTSGATEAAAMLALPASPTAKLHVDPLAHDCLVAHRRMGEHAVTGAVEHETAGGAIGADTLAMGLANSETGVISAPRRLREGGEEKGWIHGDDLGPAAWLVLDAVQLIGRVPFDFRASGAQFTIASSHKIGGPKGVGALLVRQGCSFRTTMLGGGQEQGRRSGTENVIGVAGFGAAAAAAQRDLETGVWAPIAALRDRMEARLKEAAPEAIVVGETAQRLPNTSCVAVPGWRGETQVIQMDLAGVAISAGSACSSGKVTTSRVLLAMGYDEATASSAIRISLGPTTTEAEVMAFAGAWEIAYRRWRERRST